MDGYGLLVRVRQQHSHALVTVAGEIDITTVAQLRGRLAPLAAAGRPVIADLTEVTFIDAAGLRAGPGLDGAGQAQRPGKISKEGTGR